MVSIGKVKCKKFGIKRFFNSFKYAYQGINYLVHNEQNLIVISIMGIIVITLSILLKATYLEWAILLIMIGIIISLELINTALEFTVDLSMPEIHPYAKIAKDCGSASVLVMSFVSVLVGCIIFIPKIVEFLS